ncbi:MAG: DUF4331 domain-containing protein [Nevskiaceae bacterium]
MDTRKLLHTLGGCALSLAATGTAQASSHREAPFITEMPKVDGTDFYMFRSYESGRAGFVTLIANYLPLQDSYGGPNYFFMDPDALYEIHVSNDADPAEEITFQFRFSNSFGRATIPGVITDGKLNVNGQMVQVPLINVGGGSGASPGALNVVENYTINVVRGDRRTGASQSVTRVGGGAFQKPVDNIGAKSIPDYAAYADSFVYAVSIPGCAEGKVFVGQRAEGFPVNLGQVFDQVNADFDAGTPAFNPVGAMDQGLNTIGDKNVTTLALEVPVACLKGTGDVIGAWTTASVRQTRVHNPRPQGPVTNRSANPSVTSMTLEGGAYVQVSRLGMPLVNEVVIGITDKDRFNASHPGNDTQFATYVTNPTLPELLEVLFPGVLTAPNRFPRTDLVTAFLTGVPGFNDVSGTSEMLRLNTAVAPTVAASQVNLGAAGCFDRSADADATLDPSNAGCDPAGFPNGRRPGDDVVDIALRVAMGYLLSDTDAPSGAAPLVDGASFTAADFRSTFPYLNTPNAGSP